MRQPRRFLLLVPIWLAVASVPRPAGASPTDTFGALPAGTATAGAQTASATDIGAVYYNPANLGVGGAAGHASLSLGYAYESDTSGQSPAGHGGEHQQLPDQQPGLAGLLHARGPHPDRREDQEPADVRTAVLPPPGQDHPVPTRSIRSSRSGCGTSPTRIGSSSPPASARASSRSSPSASASRCWPGSAAR